MTEQQIQVPPGLVVVTTYGQVTGETAQGMMDAQAFNFSKGLQNIAYRFVGGSLVDKARNEACRQMLAEGRGWLLFIDGDMVFPADAVYRILLTAFGTHPWANVVGAYCALRGDLALPTIDSGTGTWESHFPGSGVKEVIRTGGAFLLVKRHVCERLPQPWFAMRVPMRPVDAMAELDSFARHKYDGANPFRGLTGQPWETLERIAAEDPSTAPGAFVPVEVGEDSGFCDRVRNAGMRIVVDTNIEIQHLFRKAVGGRDHREAMQRREKEMRHVCGLLA